jgi:hypothetical protein
MNVVEDLSKFYRDNKKDIDDSLNLGDKLGGNTFVILNSKTLEVKDIYKMVKNKEYATCSNHDLSLSEEKYLNMLYLCSKYSLDSANNGILSTSKKVSSVVPDIFRFRNKKNAKGIGFVQEIKEEKYVNLYFTNLFTNITFSEIIGKLKPNDKKIVKTIVSDMFSSVDTMKEESRDKLKGFGFTDNDINYMLSFTGFSSKINKIVSSYKYVEDTNGNEVLELKIGDDTCTLSTEEDIFLVLDKEIDDIKDSYKKYIEEKLFSAKGVFQYTIGNNANKRYRLLNTDCNFLDSFYDKAFMTKETIDIVRNFALFYEIFKHIPNKYLFIDGCNTFHDKFNEKNISNVIKNMHVGTKKNNLKVLHLNAKGDIEFYDSISTANITFKYQEFYTYTHDKYIFSFDLDTVTYTRYNLYRRIMGLLDHKYIKFNDDNSKTSIPSTISKNDIMLSGVIGSIKDDLYNYLYKNSDNINIASVLDKIEKFVIDKKLYMSKNDGILAVDKMRLTKILELNRNIKNKYTNMGDMKRNAKAIYGKFKVESIDLNTSLNEKGLDIKNSNEEKNILKLDRWKESKYVSSLYLKDSFVEENKISDSDKQDIKLFSYILGVVIGYETSHSVSISAPSIIHKFNNRTTGSSITELIKLSSKYSYLRDPKDKSKYDSLYTYLLNFIQEDGKSNIKIDFNCALLGNLETMSHLYKIPNYKNKNK